MNLHFAIIDGVSLLISNPFMMPDPVTLAFDGILHPLRNEGISRLGIQGQRIHHPRNGEKRPPHGMLTIFVADFLMTTGTDGTSSVVDIGVNIPKRTLVSQSRVRRSRGTFFLLRTLNGGEGRGEEEKVDRPRCQNEKKQENEIDSP